MMEQPFFVLFGPVGLVLKGAASIGELRSASG